MSLRQAWNPSLLPACLDISYLPALCLSALNTKSQWQEFDLLPCPFPSILVFNTLRLSFFSSLSGFSHRLHNADRHVTTQRELQSGPRRLSMRMHIQPSIPAHPSRTVAPLNWNSRSFAVHLSHMSPLQGVKRRNALIFRSSSYTCTWYGLYWSTGDQYHFLAHRHTFHFTPFLSFRCRFIPPFAPPLPLKLLISQLAMRLCERKTFDANAPHLN